MDLGIFVVGAIYPLKPPRAPPIDIIVGGTSPARLALPPGPWRPGSLMPRALPRSLLRPPPGGLLLRSPAFSGSSPLAAAARVICAPLRPLPPLWPLLLCLAMVGSADRACGIPDAKRAACWPYTAAAAAVAAVAMAASTSINSQTAPPRRCVGSTTAVWWLTETARQESSSGGAIYFRKRAALPWQALSRGTHSQTQGPRSEPRLLPPPRRLLVVVVTEMADHENDVRDGALSINELLDLEQTRYTEEPILPNFNEDNEKWLQRMQSFHNTEECIIASGEFNDGVLASLIQRNDWPKVDEYLTTIVKNNISKSLSPFSDVQVGEINQEHPELAFLPRRQHIHNLLVEGKYDEANEYYNGKLAILEKCASESVCTAVSDLRDLIRNRAAAVKIDDDTGSAIKDYIYLCYPSLFSGVLSVLQDLQQDPPRDGEDGGDDGYDADSAGPSNTGLV
ncbi:hypothetical protein ABZP36_029206 [Zizania latifolia]